jgi:DNA-3-methyladenine glycosylase I
VITGADGKPRCFWCGAADDYIAYHDREWGFAVHDDHRLFEKIALEGFQSGLSWITILRKREDFRRVFHGFDFERVARFRQSDVERLLKDASIVRHRGKIEAVIQNARQACRLREEAGSLAAYFWKFEPTRRPAPAEPVSVTPESTALSKALKKRGWTFVGPTTMYAFMQAMGLVNDHFEECFVRPLADKARDQK